MQSDNERPLVLLLALLAVSCGDDGIGETSAGGGGGGAGEGAGATGAGAGGGGAQGGTGAGGAGGGGAGDGGAGNGPSFEVYFHSDWQTALGTGDAALRDAEKARPWPSLSNGAEDLIEVRSTADDGHDFPTDNYLAIHISASSWIELSVPRTASYWAEPAVGESIGARFYRRFAGEAVQPGDVELTVHPDYFDPQGTDDYGWGPMTLGWDYGHSNGSGSVFAPTIAAGNVDDVRDLFVDANRFQPYAQSAFVQLNMDTTYRFEALYTRVGETTYTVKARIYDVDGTLLFMEDDFRPQWSSDPEERLADVTFTRSDFPAGAVGMTGFLIGINGVDEPTGVPGRRYADYAAVAICSDWCGPYPIAGIE